MEILPQRRHLRHVPPSWVKKTSLYFVTICAEPRCTNQLCRPNIGPALCESAAFYHDRQRWWLKLFLLMPDHLHALLACPQEERLETVVRAWKGYQAKQLGIRWQAGFFDHRLRSSESTAKKSEYVFLNPVRAGLVARPEDWPYYWPKVGPDIDER